MYRHLMPWSTVFIGIWFAFADLAKALVAEFDGTAMLLSEISSSSLSVCFFNSIAYSKARSVSSSLVGAVSRFERSSTCWYSLSLVNLSCR